MTTHKLLLLGSIGSFIASFPLQMEILTIASAIAIWLVVQPSKEEQAEELRKQRAADIAHAHAEAYQVELARAMARKEAELMGTRPEFGGFEHMRPEDQRTTKSRTSRTIDVRKTH